MEDRRDADLTSKEYRPKSKLKSESIVMPQKVALINLNTTEEQSEEQSLSWDQGVYNLHPVTGEYNSSYSSLVNCTGVPNCLPSGKPNVYVTDLKEATFTDQSTFMTMTKSYSFLLGDTNYGKAEAYDIWIIQ